MKCRWIENDPQMEKYHDEEWGKPCFDGDGLYKILCLEIFQAGLSWKTILKRKTGLEEAFEGFEIHKVSQFDEKRIKQLWEHKAMIHHEAKIKAIVHNAQQIEKLGKEEFVRLCWSFVDGKPLMYHHEKPVARNELSDQLCLALKNLGFQFIGSTTVYSFLAAAGLINDHEEDCVLKWKQ